MHSDDSSLDTLQKHQPLLIELTRSAPISSSPTIVLQHQQNGSQGTQPAKLKEGSDHVELKR